jgi:hypothetical protein
MVIVRLIGILLLLITNAYSWNALGHRLIAQIAYDNLTPMTKKIVNRYNNALNTAKDHRSFVGAASWLDSLRYPNQRWLQPLHYINIPFTKDHSPLIIATKPNAVSAISDAISVLKSNRSVYDKGFNLRILSHVVGDIHQPMHAVSRYSRRQPKGDYGGNLTYLKNNSVATNLHAYWDRGGGWLVVKKRYSTVQLAKRARKIAHDFPCPSHMSLDSMVWAAESYNIAVNNAYTLTDKQKPTKAYHQMVSQITHQRIALAGCRLALLLNQITS